MSRQARRRRLYHKAKGRCRYCRREMVLKLGFGNTATLDHVIPKVMGGRRVVISCWRCNCWKGFMDAAMFVNMVRKYQKDGRPLPDLKPRKVSTARARRIVNKIEVPPQHQAHAGAWKRKMVKECRYLEEIGRYPILRDALINAGIIAEKEAAE